jgi:multidrug resistance efflux pump
VSQPVKARGRALTWMLAALLVILLLGVAAGGTLFLLDKQRTDQRLADQQAQIVALQKKVEEEDATISGKRAAIRTAESELAAALDRGKASEGCTAAVQALWDRAKAGDLSGVTAATQTAITACGVSLT